MQYTLMHKTQKTAEITLDSLAHIVAIEKVYDIRHLPVGTVLQGKADLNALAKWWSKRAIPASRSGLDTALAELGMTVPQELLEKCYGLSLSDQYWIAPPDGSLRWQDVNFFQHEFSEDVGNLLLGHGKSESMSLLSPDNTSDGQLRKKWKIADGKRILLKGSSGPYHQEALNEIAASRIAERLGISHVRYDLIWEDELPYNVCEDFITQDTELVSAYHILQTEKKPNHLSEYEHYIQCAENLGVTDIRSQLEKMLTLDFLIANEDRHLNNFGLVRNAETLEWLSAAPVYDCGTSLWYNTLESQIKPMAPALPAKPFRKTHGKQIGLVQNFDWLDLSRLDGIEDEIEVLFSSSPYISEERCQVICQGISRRIELLSEIVCDLRQTEGKQLQ